MSAISSIDDTWSSARSVLDGRGSSSAPAITASNKAPTPSSSAVIDLLPRPCRAGGNMAEQRLERDELLHRLRHPPRSGRGDALRESVAGAVFKALLVGAGPRANQ